MAGINKEGVVFTKVNEESFITDISDPSKVMPINETTISFLVDGTKTIIVTLEYTKINGV